MSFQLVDLLALFAKLIRYEDLSVTTLNVIDNKWQASGVHIDSDSN